MTLTALPVHSMPLVGLLTLHDNLLTCITRTVVHIAPSEAELVDGMALQERPAKTKKKAGREVEEIRRMLDQANARAETAQRRRLQPRRLQWRRLRRKRLRSRLPRRKLPS